MATADEIFEAGEPVDANAIFEAGEPVVDTARLSALETEQARLEKERAAAEYKPGAFATAATKFAQGLVPGFEQLVALGQKGGKTYEQSLAETSGALKTLGEQRPILSGVSRTAGAVAPFFATGPLAAATRLPAIAAAPTAAGVIAGGQALGQAAGRGLSAGEVAAETAKGAAVGAAIPVGFGLAGKAAQALAPTAESGLLGTFFSRAGQAAARTAPVGGMAVSPVRTLLSPTASEEERAAAATELATLGVLPTIDVARGTQRAALRKTKPLAERARREAMDLVEAEQAQAAEKAIAEQRKQEAAAYVSDVKQKSRAIADERAKSNQLARAEVAFEEGVKRQAEKLKGTAEKAFKTAGEEARKAEDYVKGLEDWTDPSLLGWRAKKFQDVARQLDSLSAAYERQFPGQPLPPDLVRVRSVLDESLIRNQPELAVGGALEEFAVDPNAAAEAYRQRLLQRGETERAAAWQRHLEADQRRAADFEGEARTGIAGKTKGSRLSDAELAAIYARRGLAFAGRPQYPGLEIPLAERAVDAARGRQYGTRIGEIETALREEMPQPPGLSEADIRTQAGITPAAAAREFAERAAAGRREVEYGTSTPDAETLRILNLDSVPRAVWETMTPDQIRLFSRIRGPGALLGGRVAEKETPTYMGERSMLDPRQSRLASPFQAFAVQEAFTKALERNLADTSSKWARFKAAAETAGRFASLQEFLRQNPDVAAAVQSQMPAPTAP